MEDIKEKIIEISGNEENKFMNFFEYFNGWLNCADSNLHSQYYEIGIKHLERANEICLKINNG